jgi:hypothetical protein
MASIDEVISALQRLTPEQVDEVARVVYELSQAECQAALPHPAVPPSVVAQAVQHGWPAHLFTELIGSLPDLERAAQPPVENRADL